MVASEGFCEGTVKGHPEGKLFLTSLGWIKNHSCKYDVRSQDNSNIISIAGTGQNG